MIVERRRVEQVSVLYAEADAELEQLRATEGRQHLVAELVAPVVEERQRARPAEE